MKTTLAIEAAKKLQVDVESIVGSNPYLDESASPCPQAQLAPIPYQAAKPSPTVFGPMHTGAKPFTKDGVYYEPVEVFVLRQEVFSARYSANAADSIRLLAKDRLRSSLGPTAAKLAEWQGADFDLETHSYRCTWLVPEDLAALARKKSQPKPETATLAEIPETLTIEVHEIELGSARSNVNPMMAKKLLMLVGTEMADKAKIVAESYDGKRGKYINVYQIPGGVASASLRKAQAKPFDRPGAGKRLIKVRKPQ